jgi:ABC-2 type transport system ATP-binding protein
VATSDTPRDALISLKSVTKNYANFKALDSVSFEIDKGQVFGYIGPNGAGKTTTIKIIVGLITNFKGDVQILGYQMPQHRYEIHKFLGYLPQNVAFQDWQTVDNALKTFGLLSGLEKNKVESRIDEVLEFLSLSDFRKKKVSQLSGGMAQKVGLAQALLHNPKLLVLDEPMGGLDPASRKQFKKLISSLAKEGTTILFSSHILSDVQDVATKIGILNRGEIRKIGTVDELKTSILKEKIVEIVLCAAGKIPNWTKISGIKSIEQPSPEKILIYLENDVDDNGAVNTFVEQLLKSGNRIYSLNPLMPSLDEVYQSYVSEVGSS